MKDLKNIDINPFKQIQKGQGKEFSFMSKKIKRKNKNQCLENKYLID